VLSFGPGKALGGIGGGAALFDGGVAPPLDAISAAPMGQVGLASMYQAVADWAIQRAPAPMRRRSVRRQRAASWWRESKADHLPQQAETVTVARPSRWQLGVTVVMLAGSGRRRAQAASVHHQAAAALAGTPLQLSPASADLCAGLEFMLSRPYDRYQVARVLAEHGVPSTWNYYPLHLMQPYRHLARGPLQSAESIWTTVLTVPKQPQPRIRGRLLVTALREAAQALADSAGQAG
jgi:perosamine synthetase